jgi:hypothetical protein
MDTALKELIDILKNVAPYVWDAALKQVYNVARWDLIWAGLLFVILLICIGTPLYISNYIKKENIKIKSSSNPYYRSELRMGNYEALWWVCFLVGALVVIGILLEVTSAGMYLGNPQWYAIHWILSINH